MIEREEIRYGKRVTIVERELSPEDKEKQDILVRLEALERHLAKNGYTVPDPPKGLVRKIITK